MKMRTKKKDEGSDSNDKEDDDDDDDAQWVETAINPWTRTSGPW